jgi:hypothetical protein
MSLHPPDRSSLDPDFVILPSFRQCWGLHCAPPPSLPCLSGSMSPMQ